MKRLAVYGAGGFGAEVRGMLEMLPEAYCFAGYFDDYKKLTGTPSELDYDDIILAIADPAVRRQLINRWRLKKVDFAPFFAPDLILHKTVVIERGSIVCPGVRITVNIHIGEFVIINLNSTIGHDVKIGRFSSLMPSVNLSGNVTIGQGVFIGTGATILQGVTVGDHSTIGAGALVNKDVASNTVVVGVPARIIEKKK